MAFINEKSPVIAHPEFEVFEDIPVQTTVVDTVEEAVIPLAQLNTGSYVEFLIKTSENEFVRGIDTLLQIRFRVKLQKTDNTAITEDDWKKVSIINNKVRSCFNSNYAFTQYALLSVSFA